MRSRTLLLLLALLAAGGCRATLPWQQAPPAGTWRLEGAEGLPQDELKRSAWRELQAISTSEFPDAEAYDAAFAMERYLRLEGYPDAQVAFVKEEGTVVFRVDAGRPACFGDVTFRGVTATPTATFEPFFDLERPGLVPFLSPGNTLYSETAVTQGVSRVAAWYRERGYLDAAVGPAENLPRPEGSHRLDILVPVEEGRPYFVRSIDVEGDATCLLDTTPHIGKPFQQSLPPALAGEIADRLGEEGYLFARVKHETTIDRESGAVAITLRAERGQRRLLRQVVVRGNRRTNPGFLRRQIPLREGQYLAKGQVDQSLQSVYRLGLWRRMDLALEPVGTNQVDYVLDVEESDSRRIDFGVGWGSWELLRGQVRYRDFNFTGRGRYFEASTRLAIRHQGLDVRVEDPWILGDRNVLSARASVLHRIERFYKYYGFNTELYYERLFDDGWQARIGYRFDARDPYDVDPFIPPDEREELEGFSRSAGLFARVRWDRRDHLFTPTSGWLLELFTFWSEPALGANLNYVELDVRGSHFLPLRDGTVLGTHVQCATKEILDDRPTLPIQERYFLGGGETVRCFGQDQLTPVDRFGTGIGGLTLFMATAELRQRLFEPIYGAVFYDVGMIDEPSFRFDGAWGHGPGVGLRLYTPVGPVRADVAYNVGDLWAGTNRFQFHFAFGFTF